MPCPSSLSRCNYIFQSGCRSLWHTNAASPWPAETKILTFSTLLWPCQLTAASHAVNKAQHPFLLQIPTLLPLERRERWHPAPAWAQPPHGLHRKTLFLPLPNPTEVPRFSCPQTSFWQNRDRGAGSQVRHGPRKASGPLPSPSLCHAQCPKTCSEPFCSCRTTTGLDWNYTMLWKTMKTRK